MLFRFAPPRPPALLCTLLMACLSLCLVSQGLHPTPDMEIEFWKSKALNLNAVFDQLQSSRIRKVLQFLESAKSTCVSPCAVLLLP